MNIKKEEFVSIKTGKCICLIVPFIKQLNLLRTRYESFRVESIGILLYLITLVGFGTIPASFASTSDELAYQKLQVEIISKTPWQLIHSFPSEQRKVQINDTMRFDIKLTCQSCEFRKIDLKKSTLNSLYPIKQYVDGKMVDILTKKDILSSQKYMHYDNRLFSSLNMKKDSAILTYADGNLKVGDVYQYGIDATIYMDILFHDQIETVKTFTDVIVKNNINNYIRTDNEKVLFALYSNRSSTTIDKETYYDFKITADDKLFRQVSILDDDKEIFLDNRLFGDALQIGNFDDQGNLNKKSNILFFPEKYFNKPVTLKIYYSEITQQAIHVKKELTTNILNFRDAETMKMKISKEAKSLFNKLKRNWKKLWAY